MRIDHIALYVFDLEKAKDFFCHYFNGIANEMYYNPKTGLRTYFISFTDGGRIEIMNRPGVKNHTFEPYCQGYIHLAVCVGSKEAVDRLTNQLQADGYEVISGPRTTGDGYYESSVKGFENNIIEITI